MDFISKKNSVLASLTTSKDYYPNIFFYLILVFAFTLPLSHAAISLFTVIFIIIYLISGDYRNKYEQIKSSKPLLTLFAFLIYSSFSLIWTEDIHEGLNNTRLFFYWLLIPVFAFYIEKKDIEKVITAFLLGMFLSELIAYGMYFDLWSVHGHGSEYPSPFMHHIIYSVFLAFTATILLYRFLSKNYGWRSKIFFLFFFLSVTGNLFISIGRTGQLAFLVSIIFVFIFHFKLTFKSLLGSVLLTLFILFSAYQLSPNFQARVSQMNHDIILIKEGKLTSSWGTRIAYWIISYKMVQDHPFFGVGLGDIDLEKTLIVDKLKGSYDFDVEFCKRYHLHNQFLITLVAGGVVSLILFLAFFYRMIKLTIKDTQIKALSLLFLIIFIIGFMSEALLQRQFSLVLFALFNGLFLAAEDKVGKKVS